MQLAAYASPLTAYAMPTGVGQHILGMCSALQQRRDVHFGLLTPRGKEAEARQIVTGHPRSRVVALPFPDRLLRHSTTLTSLVSLDRWLKDVDWVYTPVEQPVTTSRPLAVTVHDVRRFEPCIPGLPASRPAGLSWRLRMKRILARANVIATVSQFTKSRLLELFEIQRPERIVVIGNGGAENFSPVGLESDRDVLLRYRLAAGHYVVFPAGLTRRKGGDRLLETALLAYRRGANLRFVVVGRRHDADVLSELRELAARFPGLPVDVPGYVTASDLAALYRHCRAVLLLSRYEGFGIPVIEAVASGCPLLIAPQPALVEVADGAALVVEPRPEAVLAQLSSDLPRPHVDRARRWTWCACAERLVRAMREAG